MRGFRRVPKPEVPQTLPIPRFFCLHCACRENRRRNPQPPRRLVGRERKCAASVYLMFYCGAFDAAGVSADFEEKAGFAAGIVRRFLQRAAFGKKAEILYGLRIARVFEMPEAGVMCGVLQ